MATIIDHNNSLTAIADELADAKAKRDRAILAAHADGMSNRFIGECLGLSHTHVARIIAAATPVAKAVAAPAPKTQAHALDEIESVRHGVIVGCRCGWTEHVKDAVDARKAARKALAAHKAAAK